MASRLVIEESKSGDAGAGAADFAFAASAAPFEYPSFSGAHAARWAKWGLASARLVRLSVVRGGRDPAAEGDAFLRDLFASDALRAELPALARAARGARVRARALRTGAASLALFDPLEAAGALRAGAGGALVVAGRQEEAWGGLAIVHAAREALCLPPEGDPEGEDPAGDAAALVVPNRFSDAFDAAARGELLFALARWVVAGGGMCQWEDAWAPYADAVRDVARDLLSVVRAEGAGADAPPRVVSAAWKVAGVDGAKIFPRENPHNVCLVVADPLRRVVHVLWSPFEPWAE